MSQQLLNWNRSGTKPSPATPDVVATVNDDTASRAHPSGSTSTESSKPQSIHIGRLSREQVIDEIISSNPSASAEFLCEFCDDRLRMYLTRLRSSKRARGRESLWIRPGDSPAIMTRERLL